MSQYDKEDIKCEGPMQKKGGMRWQKRYFILSQNGTRPAQLAYFKDRPSCDDDGDARATLELTSDTKVDLLLGKSHAFQVILKGIYPIMLVLPISKHRSCTQSSRRYA